MNLKPPSCDSVVRLKKIRAPEMEDYRGASDGSISPMKARNGGESSSIAERRAAACGFNATVFNAPWIINTARVRSRFSPLSSPAAPSPPYITIPAGISPSALLDSPIVLRNYPAEPSPTTEAFQFPPNDENLVLAVDCVTPAVDGDGGSNGGSSVRFACDDSPVSLPCISVFETTDSSPYDDEKGFGGVFDFQTLSPMRPEIAFEFPENFPNEADAKNSATESSLQVNVPKGMVYLVSKSCHTGRAANHVAQHREPIHSVNAGTPNLSAEGGQKGTYPPMGVARNSEDGYSWRKYGQKQVKGSEYPRSYYKCTHPNCQAKKKLECCHDGHIAEIVYNGAHNHPKPQNNRQPTLGSSFLYTEMLETGEASGFCAKVEGEAVWRNIQPGCSDSKVSSDSRPDGLEERKSPMSVLTEISDIGISRGAFESVGSPELSSTLANLTDECTTRESISCGEDTNDDEPEMKRRKTESETNLVSRADRERRTVFQIESEVDILDDGYRWRKYGQKVVKGNPNPRSYYKCTSAGCSVRKHVERASHNLKAVIVTYEGKHNHEVPAAKVKSGAMNLACCGTSSPAASTTPPTLTLPRHARARVLKPEDGFLANPDLNPEFMRSGLPGNFGSDARFGAYSSMYEMKLKLPLLRNLVPYYGSFARNPHSRIKPATVSLPLDSIPRSSPNMAPASFDLRNFG